MCEEGKNNLLNFLLSFLEGTNTVAVDLIVKHISNQLEKVGTVYNIFILASKFGSDFKSKFNWVRVDYKKISHCFNTFIQTQQRGFNFRSELISNHVGEPLPSNLHEVENTPQVRGLQAIIRYVISAFTRTLLKGEELESSANI